MPQKKNAKKKYKNATGCSEGAACLEAVDVARQDKCAVHIDLRALDVLNEQLVHLQIYITVGYGKGREGKGKLKVTLPTGFVTMG